MNNEQIEFLATQVINDNGTLSIITKAGSKFEYNLNDAIEETSHNDYAQEALRAIINCKVNPRESYEQSLIEYTGDMIEHWLNSGYEIFIKV